MTDLARALDFIIHAPASKVDGEVFNVGSGRTYRSIKLLLLLLKL